MILTTDMWTSRTGEGYFSLTAHITEEFEIHSSHLQLHLLPGVHDHVHISEVINDSHADWCVQLDTDVVAFNGSNIKKSLKMTVTS